MNLYENTLLNENVRLQSFQTWPVPNIVAPGDLAQSGFYYLNESDTVTCIYCNGQIKNWELGDNPDREHKRFFPNCPFVRSVISSRLEDDVGCQFDGAIQGEVHINVYREPHNIDYANLESRLASFSMWPKALAQTPEKLAEAGFFYMGYGDAVQCFSCEICFMNWEPQDDPWIEHVKGQPKCRYLLTMKGEDFVKRYQSADLNNNENIINIQSPACSETSIKQTVIPTIKDTEDSGNTSACMEETLIKDGKLCKICMVEEAVVVFLPCSHLVACMSCTPKLKHCPICRSDINDTFRIFPS